VTDVRLTNGRLHTGRHVDIQVVAGRIAAITDHDPAAAAPSVDSHDLEGWLVLPALAEAHAHLDKALTAERVPNPAGDLMGAIDAWIAAGQAGLLTQEDLAERAARALDLLLVHGVTAVRTHIDVGAVGGASGISTMVQLRRRFAELMDIQLVALMHSPMTGPGSEANRAALDAAIEAGADMVGGCPALEPDGPAFIAHAIDVAMAADLPMDLHVDETLDPATLTLRDLARQLQDRGFPHRVAASHCVSLGMQPAATQAAVAAEVAVAGITVVTLPQTNLFLQGREHQTATPRGLTALAALRAAGAAVVAGADNVQDPFNLVGRSDPLETAALLVMAGHIAPDDAYAMVSTEVRRAMGLAPVTVSVGDPADLLVIDAPSVRAAIADAPGNRRVYRHGRLVASSSATAAVYRGG
jgi:cytosine deaminase